LIWPFFSDLLREIFGFTAAEAAYVTGRNDGAVNAGLCRARARLKELCASDPHYRQLTEPGVVGGLIATLDATTELINRVFSTNEKTRLRELLSNNASQGGSTGCRTTRT